MIKESLTHKKQRASLIINELKKLYPHAHCALHHRNPYELLVATILSAQCTDVRVNLVTPNLFAEFPTPAAMAGVPVEKIETLIASTGFFRNKAKSLKESAADIVSKHHGEVPQSMEALTALRGVGRKTANVVLGNAFQQNVGIVVDTHVSRLSERLHLTRHADPVKIEKDLIQLVPQNEWTLFSHWLIFHGRQICVARKPRCTQCSLLKHCPLGKKLIATSS